ncbi:MAG: vWA domain-containing protein [Actinomycetes bacterium]
MEVDVVLAGFARALRAAGVPVTPDRTAAFLVAAGEVGADSREGVYWAGRATLCSEPDHLASYDAVFGAWFAGRFGSAGRRAAPVVRAVPTAPLTGEGEGADERDADAVRAAASAVEVLRHRDVAELSAAERADLARAFGSLAVGIPRRRGSRRRPTGRGEMDARRTLREQMRRAGEVGPARWRRRTTRPRRVVLLVDVSGSMSPYADALLRLAHRVLRSGMAGRAHVEVFTIGTRLTRLTPALRAHRDPEAALRAAGELVPDWSGGTRLGDVLRAFADRWGQRGLARGAVLVVCSDGWERGDVSLLAEQTERLRRLSHRLVWVNPHRGKAGYAPVQQGIAAVLPHVDDFVAGHSLAAFEQVLEVVGRA